MVGSVVTEICSLNCCSFFVEEADLEVIFESFSVRIPVETPVNVTVSFHGFRQSFQEKSGRVTD